MLNSHETIIRHISKNKIIMVSKVTLQDVIWSEKDIPTFIAWGLPALSGTSFFGWLISAPSNYKWSMDKPWIRLKTDVTVTWHIGHQIVLVVIFSSPSSFPNFNQVLWVVKHNQNKWNTVCCQWKFCRYSMYEHVMTFLYIFVVCCFLSLPNFLSPLKCSNKVHKMF